MDVRGNVDTPAPDISVIIPVFNTEKYLTGCLESVRAQTLSSFECVMVDGGSADKSYEICAGFAKKDPRFIVMKQEDRGAGAARIFGLKNARGRYVTFFDGDDTFEPEALRLMCAALDSGGADVVAAGVRSVTDGGRELCTHKFRAPLPDENPIEYAIDADLMIHALAARRSLTDGLPPPLYGMGEDTFIIFKILLSTSIEKIIVIDNVIYNFVRSSAGSGTLRCLKEFHAESFLRSPYGNYEALLLLLREEKVPESIIEKYITLGSWGYLHMTSVYLTLNKSRPSSDEIQNFLLVHNTYHKKWNGRFYEKLIIPFYACCFPLARLYRLLLAFGNRIRYNIRIKFGGIYDF